MDTPVKIRCSRCREIFPASTEFFSPRHDAGTRGFYSHCKRCTRKTYNSRQHAFRKMLAGHGLMPDDYDRMFADQGGRCAICQQPETVIHKGSGTTQRLSVDHSHVTGAVRGLLCRSCNLGIGKLCDSPDVLRRAADYIEASR